mmetsp:Transcript_9238/g.20959  ORF Transcript_9238/g.20959 Transcript_9238/m.20959 type:complete len:461 (-) Transcript_9238:32-1414(-)
MPDPLADEDVLALVDLGRLDQLLLQGRRDPPVDHVARTLHVVRPEDKACIVGSQAGREHAGAPRPVHGDRLQLAAEEVGLLVPVHQLVDLADVLAGDHGLLLAGVGDLRDRGDGPLGRRHAVDGDAACVAIADSVDAGVALLICGPEVARLRLHRERHVHEDPLAAAGAALAQGLLGHEVVGRLHADADVLLVAAVRQVDPLPEGLALGIVLGVVELLDVVLRHVPLAVLGGGRRQGAEGLVQEVDDGVLELREEVAELGDPLHADEARTDHEDGGLLLVELPDVVVLLENVAPAPLQEALIQVRPRALRLGLGVDGGEPERLAPLVEGAEVAAAGDDAEVEVDHLVLRGEHLLDRGGAPGPVQLENLAPDVLAAHLLLDDGVEAEREGVQVLRLHVRAQDSGGVLEELLGIHDRDQEVVAEVARGGEAREAAADDEHAPLGRRHGDLRCQAGERERMRW